MKQKRDSQEVHLCDDVQVYQGTEKNYAGCGTLVKPDGSDTSGSSNTPNNSPSVTPTTTKDKPTPSKSRDKEDEEDDDDESDGDMDEHASSSESSSDSAASSAVEVTQSEVESLGSSDTIEDNSSADDVGVPEIDSSALPRTTLAGNNASWALAVTLAWLVALNPS